MRELRLGVRIHGVLTRLGGLNMTQEEFAATFSEHDIMSVFGAGRGTARKIRDRLAVSMVTLVRRVRTCEVCGEEVNVLRDGSLSLHEHWGKWCKNRGEQGTTNMNDASAKDLGTMTVTMANGSTKAFVLRSTVRQGDPVLEVRDAASGGRNVWTIFQFGSLPVSVDIAKVDVPKLPHE